MRAAATSGEAVPGLELRDISQCFGDTQALAGLSITVGEGELFGLVGANGAGKTTTMRIVMGVLVPDHGEVLWRGEQIDTHVRRRFGYMPEERGLYARMRVREQLAYFAHLHGMAEREGEEAAWRWTKRMGLEDRANDRVEKLSLGNQQRVQLATALVHDPALLILDEPFSGLDPKGVDSLSEVLRERARAGVPVVFSSHQLELVQRLCDSVAILDAGRVVKTTRADRGDGHRAGRTLGLEVVGADGPWWRALAGVALVEARTGGEVAEGGQRVRLALDDGVDEQMILDAARTAGRVMRFGFDERSLVDLYRESVGDND